MSEDLRYSPHFIKARADAPDLLADIEPFEQVGCLFLVVANELIRAKLRDPHAEELTVRGVTFRAVGLRERLQILSHVAKPSEADPTLPTLRPFGDLLAQHGITEARLVSPNSFAAWVEVRRDRGGWRKLQRTEQPPAPPPPTTVIEPAIPPAPDLQEEPA